MAELIKYKSHEALTHIRHDMRELPIGKLVYGNKSIDTSLSDQNYSLIRRGNNASEINRYRKDIEKKLFKYGRQDLVHAVELVIQCPEDCFPSQERDFFEASYEYAVKHFTSGEEFVVLAEVHKDEHTFITLPDGTKKDISKSHLHLMWVPGVPDQKHKGYDYKLCADQQTKRATLKSFHPGLQKHLEDKGIQATVYRKKSKDGKTIPLSVKQLKEITNKTGITIKKSLTIDELADILKVNQDIEIKDKELQRKLAFYQNKAIDLSLKSKDQDATISSLQENLQHRDSKIKKLETMLASKEDILDVANKGIHNSQHEIHTLKSELQKRELEQQKLLSMVQEKSIALEFSEAKNKKLETEITSLKRELFFTQDKLQTVETDKGQVLEQQHNENIELQKLVESLQNQLSSAQEKITELQTEMIQKTETIETNVTESWGQSNAWGQNSSWENTPKQNEEERLW